MENHNQQHFLRIRRPTRKYLSHDEQHDWSRIPSHLALGSRQSGDIENRVPEHENNENATQKESHPATENSLSVLAAEHAKWGPPLLDANHSRRCAHTQNRPREKREEGRHRSIHLEPEKENVCSTMRARMNRIDRILRPL